MEEDNFSLTKNSPRLIRLPAVMHLTGLARSTVWSYVKRGIFPKPIKLSDRVTVWRFDEVEAWINEKIDAAHGA